MSQQAKSLLSLSVVSITLIAQYRGVSYQGGQIAVANAKAIGISERPTTVIGEVAIVTTKGTAVAEAGAAIALGAALAFDAQGRVIPAATLAMAVVIAAGAIAVTSTAANGALANGSSLSGGDLPQYIVGYALQAASAPGDLIEILMS